MFFFKITALFNTIIVEQEFYYMPNGLTSKIPNKIAPGMLGGNKEMVREKNC